MDAEKYYDLIAEYYDARVEREVLTLAEDRSLLEYLGVDSKMRVLDAGCGTGMLLDRLDASVSEDLDYVGYDVSAGMVEQFKKKWPKKRVTHMSVTSQDEHIELLNGFDLVLSLYTVLNCLKSMGDISIAVRNLWACVKPGGRMVLVCYGTVYPEERKTSSENLFKDIVPHCNTLVPSPRNWRLLLENLQYLDRLQIIPFSEDVLKTLRNKNYGGTLGREITYENCYELLQIQMRSLQQPFLKKTKWKVRTDVHPNHRCDYLICDLHKELLT